MDETGPEVSEVDGVLDELIRRLSRSKRTADQRAALIEARRLKSIATKWVAILPPPEARREFMARLATLMALAPDEAPSERSGPTQSSGAGTSSTAIARLSIHDEDTAPAESKRRAPPPAPSSRGRHVSKRKAAKGEPASGRTKGFAIHDEDTAPGPGAMKLPIFDEETSPSSTSKLFEHAVVTPRVPRLTGGMSFIGVEEEDWDLDAAGPGVHVRVLLHDTAAGRVVALLRIDPEGALLARTYERQAEIVLLYGDASIGGHVMYAGECCRLDSAATRPALTTTIGCTVLFRGSDVDAP